MEHARSFILWNGWEMDEMKIAKFNCRSFAYGGVYMIFIIGVITSLLAEGHNNSTRFNEKNQVAYVEANNS